MNRVTHFEINADDPSRADKFYSTVFGWEIKKWDSPHDYWLVSTGNKTEPGINGGIMKRMDKNTTINTIEVSSVDEYIEKVEKMGGRVVTPKMTVEGMGYMAYCADTEGNTFGLMQMDENVK